MMFSVERFFFYCAQKGIHLHFGIPRQTDACHSVNQERILGTGIAEPLLKGIQFIFGHDCRDRSTFEAVLMQALGAKCAK